MEWRPNPVCDQVYLTFDDGPDPRWTPYLLDLLALAGARATFFVVGRQACRHAGLLRRMVREGHAVGNHTWSHRHPMLLTGRTARREVRGGQAAIEDALGAWSLFYRPPHGAVRDCMVAEAESGGQKLVLWTRSALDWGPMATCPGISRRLAGMGSGDIVLMHDRDWGINRPARLMRILPHQLRILRMSGLSAVSLPGKRLTV